MLKPIKLTPVALTSVLGGNDEHEESLSKRSGESLIGFTEQLIEVAALAEISVEDLMANVPLLTFATKTYGLGAATERKKRGRPTSWDDIRLFHLWLWVHRRGDKTIAESLTEYLDCFETHGIGFESLENIYKQQAVKCSAVTFQRLLTAQVGDLADEFFAIIECASKESGTWPKRKGQR